MGETIYAEFKSSSGFRLVADHPRKERVPAYDRIGGNMEFKTSVQGYTKLYRTISELPKMANWLLWRLMETKNSKTNIAVFIASTPLEAKNVTIAYKELKAKGLVRRVSKQHYLLNPEAFIPWPNYVEVVCEHWKSVVEEAKP